MRRDVEFQSEGVICRGWLYTPEGRGAARWPLVVMAHGFSGVKELRLDRFAEAFAGAGLASLVFDYRGFGCSDGAPRQDLDPQAQVTDYRNAISFARRSPEVDAERIGVWGTSYSGGHALVVGALDRRVRAVVAQVPLIDGWESMERLGGGEMRDYLVAQLIEERERVYAGATPSMIPVIDKSGGFAALGTPDAYEWFDRHSAAAPAWKNEVTLRSLERMLEYAPGRWIDRIAPTPLLVIAAEHDFLPIDMARRAFERAGEPKRFCSIPAAHFEVYEDPHFATAAAEASSWFARHLGGA